MKNMPMIFAFVKVAQWASFSRAAEKTGVSKSHLSKMVKDLEGQINKTLFTRTTRNVELTEFGKHFFSLCKHHVSEVERVMDQAKEYSRLSNELIRITLAGAYGEDVVAPVISRLLLRYPSLKVEMIFSEKVLNLLEDNLDLAIRVSLRKPKEGHAIQIGSREEHVCASENYLRLNGVPQKPSDLRRMNCLMGSSSSWIFKNGSRSQKIAVQGNFRSTNGRSLAQAAKMGVGVAKLPTVYVEQALRDNRLIPILQGYNPGPVPIWALTPIGKEVSPALKLIIEELQTEIPSHSSL